MTTRTALGLMLCAALCFATGCFKSSTTQASFGSSSDFSSSPFKSSSKSSSGDDENEAKDGEEETAFQRDVRNFTVEFARTSDEADVASIQRGLGDIAEGHGFSDWERSEGAFVAIGRGLGESELDDENAKQLAVALSNEDYDHLMLIRSGFESRRSP